MKYLLIMILHYNVGIMEPTILKGNKPLDWGTCMEQGSQTANWLTQDFVKVEWECRPINSKQ